MTSDAPDPVASEEETRLTDRDDDLVWWATWLGVLLALVGLVDGVMMALNKKVANCPDGTYFAEDTTDFNCYVHPQAGVGIAIAVISVLLGILVVFGSIATRASLKGRPTT